MTITKIFSMGNGESHFTLSDGGFCYWSGWKNGERCSVFPKEDIKKMLTSETKIEEAWAGGKTLNEFREIIQSL